MCIYVYIHIYVYIYIYTYTYTCKGILDTHVDLRSQKKFLAAFTPFDAEDVLDVQGLVGHACVAAVPEQGTGLLFKH